MVNPDKSQPLGRTIELPIRAPDLDHVTLRLVRTVIDGCPAAFVTARPEMPPSAPAWLSDWAAASGRAMTLEDAQIGAVFEAIERASLISEGPDDPRPKNRSNLPLREDNNYWHLSGQQLSRLKSYDEREGIATAGPPGEVAWMPAFDLLTDKERLVPCTAVFSNEDVRLGWPALISSSTGAAAHTDVESAIRTAVLERVERDAVAIWWYNRLPAPRLAKPEMMAALPPALAAWLAERRRITWALVTATDLPVPAFVALSSAPDGTQPALGTAAHLDPRIALRSAVLEMLQCEIGLTHMRELQATADAPPRPALLVWSDATNALATPYIAGEGAARLPPAIDFETLLGAFAEHGIDIAVADLTRPEFAIPVVKAVSRTLRDWQPRFASGRLYDVPVSLGRLAAPRREADLNPVPFVI
ncbi:hypothetical protein DLJ53_17725 [Acuticoccus sediminis]|uniref:YcaO domain-containing protein n=2 Tax=Acuticoccus sediminis TaxID=2184697 RepID=A0A8B2NMZ1_9HYPH|nr:hypothetical protein DLJ53_17725 [Acuticoccus sediminis]